MRLRALEVFAPAIPLKRNIRNDASDLNVTACNEGAPQCNGSSSVTAIGKTLQVDAIGIHVFTCYAGGLKYHLDRYRALGPWLRISVESCLNQACW